MSAQNEKATPDPEQVREHARVLASFGEALLKRVTPREREAVRRALVGAMAETLAPPAKK